VGGVGVALTAATEELWEAHHGSRNRQAREKLILQSAHLVKYVAGRLAVGLSGVLDAEDVTSAGMIGLIRAVERFDLARGVPFESYAMTCIRGTILDQLRSLDVVSRSSRQKAREIEKAIAEAQLDLGRTPTDEEVAGRMGLDIECYQRRILEAGPTTIYLETELSGDGEEDGGSLLCILEDPSSPDPVSLIERRALMDALAKAVLQLSDREKLLLSLYYKEDLTMREISKVLDISESRVCQLHTRAVVRLRASLGVW
jgi:RNA polymerase sigma factor for flagellar operon FliA